ncbi:MAG: hypothetical protein H0U71_05125 [Gammaproteobacteria bacterium]|nr:hypothetical protein [Gammaproteobacteria bacterium]
MRKKIILILILFSFVWKTYAITNSLRQEYPNSLLTDDYGILIRKDLKSEKPAPFLLKNPPGYVYWQCFPRDRLVISLEDFGSTAEDIGIDENYSSLKITASNKHDISHEYVMRRRWPLSVYERRFNSWIKLMKGENYVCIAGEFFNYKAKMEGGKRLGVCSWIFEKIKTKKGQDSYFTKNVLN